MPLVARNLGSRNDRMLLRDEARREIRRAILEGELLPGERIDDHEIQAWLGISRTPIREALNALAQEGFVETAAQRYTRVIDPDPKHVTAITQTLGVLFAGAVRLAVPLMCTVQRQISLHLLDSAIVAAETHDIKTISPVILETFGSYVSASGNEPLIHLCETTVGVLGYRMSVSMRQETVDWDRLVLGLGELRRATNSGDAVLAELAVEYIHYLPESPRVPSR